MEAESLSVGRRRRGMPALEASTGGANYDRLAQLKTTYNPENVFHLNPNVKPAVQPTRVATHTRQGYPRTVPVR